MVDEFTYEPRVAYFTMEIALRNEIPTYAGGLGILAGDTVRSAADLGLPLVAVSLVSRSGYFRQQIDARGRQLDHPDPWEPSNWARPLKAKVAVSIEQRLVWVSAWLYVLESKCHGDEARQLLEPNSEDLQVLARRRWFPGGVANHLDAVHAQLVHVFERQVPAIVVMIPCQQLTFEQVAERGDALIDADALEELRLARNQLEARGFHLL